MAIITDQIVVTGQRKVVKSFEPTFSNIENTIQLQIYTVIETEQNGVWTEVPDTVVRSRRKTVIHNEMYIDPATELVVIPPIDVLTGEPDFTGLIGAYDYLISRSGTEVGMTSLNDIVFSVVLMKLESFIEANGLHL